MIDKITFDSIKTDTQLLLALREAIEKTNQLVLDPLVQILVRKDTAPSSYDLTKCANMARDYNRKHGTVSTQYAARQLIEKLHQFEIDNDSDSENIVSLVEDYLQTKKALRSIAYNTGSQVFPHFSCDFDPLIELKDLSTAHSKLLDFLDKALCQKGIICCLSSSKTEATSTPINKSISPNSI